MTTYFYRRSLTRYGDASANVIYAVESVIGEKRDLIPVTAAFPGGWRPTDFPGQVLRDDGEERAIFVRCLLPRAKLEEYMLITEAEAELEFPGFAEARTPPG